MIAGIGSGVVAAWMYFNGYSMTTIAPVDSLLIALVVYLGLEMGSRKMGKT